MSNMSPEQREQCHATIHTASVAAGVAASGLSRVPLSDNAVITPIQMTMVANLGRIFGMNLSEAAARGALSAELAGETGQAIAHFLAGWIPDLEGFIRIATAAGITEIVGWSVAEDFAEQTAADHVPRYDSADFLAKNPHLRLPYTD